MFESSRNPRSLGRGGCQLSKIRALTLQHTSDLLSAEDSNAPWVREAIQKHGHELGPDVVAAVTTLRFGDKAVSYDPSDPEANSLAVAKGYVVVHGGQMSGKEWAAVRAAGVLKPAGQVTPSPKPYSVDGDPLRIVPESDWTPDMQGLVHYVRRIAPHLVGREIAGVRIANDPQWPFAATYGLNSGLTLNLGRLGHKWFSGPLLAINDLLIHEFGHHTCSNHLSEDYYDALTRLGAKLVDLALEQPEVFSLKVELQTA